MSEDMNNWLEMETEAVKPEVGEIVKGEVIQVSDSEAYVFVKGLGKQEIPVDKANLAYPVPESAKDVVKEGEIIDVLVVSIGGENGGVLSKVKADRLSAWKDLEGIDECREDGSREVIEAEITGVVKGGVVAAAKGVRAFIPASQIDTRYVKDLNQYVGQTVRTVAIKVEPAKQRLVLSRRELLEKERDAKVQEVFSTIEAGQTVKGVVKRFVSFGAFIDVGGVDGLVHITEISWGRVKNIADVLKIGQELDVFVKSVDKENKKISLSIKEITPDPWFEQAARYEEGAMITGKIVKLTDFGAFMEIEPGFDGLIPMGELAARHIKKADEAVQVGQEVTVKILHIETKRKRISLSITKADGFKADVPAEEPAEQAE